MLEVTAVVSTYENGELETEETEENKRKCDTIIPEQWMLRRDVPRERISRDRSYMNYRTEIPSESQ